LGLLDGLRRHSAVKVIREPVAALTFEEVPQPTGALCCDLIGTTTTLVKMM